MRRRSATGNVRASPATTVFNVPYVVATGGRNPRRQSGCVSNASLSLRSVVPWTAPKPSPRRANDAQTVHVSRPSIPPGEPPVNAFAAAMTARLETTRPGKQPLQLQALDDVPAFRR